MTMIMQDSNSFEWHFVEETSKPGKNLKAAHQFLAITICITHFRSIEEVKSDFMYFLKKDSMK